MLTEHPQFFTVTILNWKHLLKPDKYKDIIMGSLKFLAENKRIMLDGFVSMPNQLHLIWQMQENRKQRVVQQDFLKYTAQQIKFYLQHHHPAELEEFQVPVKDRTYQFWKHRPLSIPLWSKAVFEQKLDYIHQNPVQ